MNMFKRINQLDPIIDQLDFKIISVVLIIIAFIAFLAFKKKQKNKMESFSFLMKPYLADGDKIYIKTLDNKYWSALACGSRANINNACDSLIAITDIPYLTSQFTFHKHIDGTFSLETYNSKYLKRCSKCFTNSFKVSAICLSRVFQEAICP